MFAGEKTEPATPKRRREARNKGQVAKSMELPSAIILMFSFLFLLLFGYTFKNQFSQLLVSMLTDGLTYDLTKDSAPVLMDSLILQGFKLVGPFLAACVLLAVLGNYIQIGFLFTREPLVPKLSKLNPVTGAKRFFSAHALVEMGKSLVKLLIVGLIVYLSLHGEIGRLMAITTQPLNNVLGYAARLILLLCLKFAAALLVLAVLDYYFQRYQYEKSLRMSKQDIKDEYKQSEGDPLIKGKIRERQRKIALQRMMQEVPKADVVITNPTHYAVALKYEGSTMEAPQVVAKGQDYLALRIKEIAREHGVVTMENRPLARALYTQTEIGDQVPAELFQAVAEVLAYVYKLKRRMR